MSFIATPTVIAVLDRVARAVGSYNRRSGSLSANATLIVGVLLIAAVWAALYFWDRWRRGDRRNDPARARTAFEELAAVHALDGHDRQLLALAAERAGFEEPAFVFVRPDVLQILGDGPEAASVERLARRLYGDLG